MPTATATMSWDGTNRRWMKWHKGKMYAISCRQLGVEGKTESKQAANDWWATKVSELEPEAPPCHPRSEQIVEALEKWKGQPMTSDEEVKTFVVGLLTAEKPPTWLLDAVLGKRAQEIEDTVKATGGVALEPAKTIAGQVDAWTAMLRNSCRDRGGNISFGRYDAYRRKVQWFVKFVGAGLPLAAITAEKWAGFWTHLAELVAGEEISCTYAGELMMTAKQFVNFLGELGLIVVPGNLGSRRLGFSKKASDPVQFTIGEVRDLLRAGKDRCKLFLLLALNCGMYQSDISDLQDSEVDWKRGTITRFRSKRKGKSDAQLVTYKLWDETLRLLEQERSGEDTVLLTPNGCKLVMYGEGGKQYDLIMQRFRKVDEKVGTGKPFKCLRKTSAQLLYDHRDYSKFADYFLAHAPKSIMDRHYVKPDDGQFAEALQWLGGQYGV